MINDSFKNINGWLTVSIFILFLILVPILTIFFNSIQVNNDVWQHIYENLFFKYTLNSLTLVIGVFCLTFFFGVTSAWFISFYEIPFKDTLSLLLILPIAIPPYAVAYSYADISDSIQNYAFLNIRSKIGAIFILSITLYPYVFLITKYSFLKNAHRTMEAAANLGAKKMELFYKFALPLSRPAIAASMALVIMETLADFGVVHYLGVDSLSVGIYKAWFGLEDINSSARLASILFLLAFLIVFLEKFLRRKEGEKYVAYGTLNKSELFKNSIFSPMFFLLILLLLSFFIPVLWLISSVIKSNSYNNLGILFAFLNTLKLGFLGSLLVVISALLLAFSKRSMKRPLSYIFNMAKIGYAAPGIVIAIGIIIPIIFIDKKINTFFQYFNLEVGLILSSSMMILLLAYLVRFFSVAYNPIEAAYEKISKKIDFISFNLGASNKRLFLKIHIPMISLSILIAYLLVFIDILKELPATLILRPFNFNTLSITTFEYASSEQLMMAAKPALLITLLAAMPLIFVHKKLNK